MEQPQPEYGFFFAAIGGIAATLTLTATLAVYGAAQSAASRYGLRFSDLGGRRYWLFASAGTFLATFAFLEAAVSADPEQDSAFGIDLPFAGWSTTPDTALWTGAGLLVLFVLAAWLGARVLRMTAPTHLGLALARSAKRSEFLDYQFAVADVPLPPASGAIVREGTAVSIPFLDAYESRPVLTPAGLGEERGRREELEKKHQRIRAALAKNLEKGVLRNPLGPSVSALHQLMTHRELSSFVVTWRRVLECLERWQSEAIPGAYADWISVEQIRQEELNWLWFQMRELVEAAVVHGASSFAGATIRQMVAAFPEAARLSDRREGPTRHLYLSIRFAVERESWEALESAIDLLDTAAQHALESRDDELFGRTCLAIGYVAEISAHLPRRATSIIAENREDEFPMPLDPAHKCAEVLRWLASLFREKPLEDHPKFLLDAIALCSKASHESGQSARGETIIVCIYALGELVAYAARRGGPDRLGGVAVDLKESAEQMATGNYPGELAKRAWDSISWHVLEGMLAFRDGPHGNTLDPHHFLIECVKYMPDEYRPELGEIANRAFLGRGVENLQAVRVELEHELGALPGWYY